MVQTLIVIPARYGSTRLPGKPLALIAKQTMLQRVVRLSKYAIRNRKNASVIVATDDARIVDHCDSIGVGSIMTAANLPTGTDRAAEVLRKLPNKPDFILNMQGDAPLTPPDFLESMIDAFIKAPCDAITPVTQLSWEGLDLLRQQKTQTPFSGTTALFDAKSGKAFWFSKAILPTLRDENELRLKNNKSPVYRHIGLYGYSAAMLEKYSLLPKGRFEIYEGLEQLRLLEHGCSLHCVPVDYRDRASMSGVDSPEDIIRAEQLIAKHGELVPYE